MSGKQAIAHIPAILRRQRGFSLIEVLITLVVLAIGLLGLGLLQTMNLRYTQSAQQRTQAVNLAGELLDTIRANRSQLNAYSTITTSSFSTVTVPSNGCGAAASVVASVNIAQWRCRVRETLGTDATADVQIAGSAVKVKVVWSEVGMGNGDVELETVL